VSEWEKLAAHSCHREYLQVRKTHLVTITPPEVLGADVLIAVLRLLRARDVMSDVLPVSVPAKLSIHASDDKGGDGNTIDELLVTSQIY